MKKIFTYLIASLMLIAGAAHAQQITLNSGSKKGTYYALVDQMIAACPSDGVVTNVEELGGSPATITAVTNNKASGGIVQYDVLWMRSKNQDLSTIKMLFPMHTEQVHVIALNKDVKKGGFLGYGGTVTVLNNVSSLKGLPVAAQGGSLYTAQAINQISGLNMQIQSDYKDTDAVKAALLEGKIPAAFIVGGAPMSIISSLDKRFRILPFDQATIEKLKEFKVYRPKTVVYENLSTTGVQTVETDALMIVYNYKTTTKMGTALTKFRECVKTNIDDLAETPGNHAAWRSVDMTNTGRVNWDFYGAKP